MNERKNKVVLADELGAARQAIDELIKTGNKTPIYFFEQLENDGVMQILLVLCYTLSEPWRTSWSLVGGTSILPQVRYGSFSFFPLSYFILQSTEKLKKQGRQANLPEKQGFSSPVANR